MNIKQQLITLFLVIVLCHFTIAQQTAEFNCQTGPSTSCNAIPCYSTDSCASLYGNAGDGSGCHEGGYPTDSACCYCYQQSQYEFSAQPNDNNSPSNGSSKWNTDTARAARRALRENLNSTDASQQWISWKLSHSKRYLNNAAENRGNTVFQDNLAACAEHNADTTQTYTRTYRNNFGDLSPVDFFNQQLQLKPESWVRGVVAQNTDNNNNNLFVDWRGQNAVTSVKSQGSCGNCYTYSSAGAVEALSAIGGNRLRSFSTQELTDCSQAYGNQGCNGGFTTTTFGYFRDNGISTDRAYPSTGTTQACNTALAGKAGNFKILGHINIAAGDVDQLAAAVARQPVAVGVDARNWQFYQSGVFSDCGTSINHAALIVGYTPDYWIIKNSWGVSWGMNGYIRLARGNTCALANSASYPSNNQTEVNASNAARQDQMTKDASTSCDEVTCYPSDSCYQYADNQVPSGQQYKTCQFGHPYSSDSACYHCFHPEFSTGPTYSSEQAEAHDSWDVSGACVLGIASCTVAPTP